MSILTADIDSKEYLPSTEAKAKRGELGTREMFRNEDLSRDKNKWNVNRIFNN